MELIRTFLAVPPDDALGARLAALLPVHVRTENGDCATEAGAPPARDRLPVPARVDALESRARRAPAEDAQGVRWADPAGLHVTLVFLGATRVAQIDALCAQLKVAARTLSAFAYALAGPLLFPDARRPRVLALEPLDPAGFAAWHAPLAAICAQAGFPREARAYRPHLSLARLRRAPGRAIAPLPAPLAGWAREIVLYQSHRGRYQPLFRARCGAAGCPA